MHNYYWQIKYANFYDRAWVERNPRCKERIVDHPFDRALLELDMTGIDLYAANEVDNEIKCN